uniref:ABI family, member 3 (NESH) binding protein b n=1 Tax=Mastacembelus armatus TaxID=205130 RepID=A0A7N8XDE4_9TELE
MKVQINATGDTIIMKFVRPSPNTKLEGYILGYGRSMFSKQFIPLPENGEPYETEMDAEPKYLVAVQPIPANDVKKHCTGKVNLEKPLHLVIGSVSPTAVLLSWGNYLKTPYEGNIMNEFYTIRYRERNRKWIYQTCPTSDTVIDNLKPNTAYEFGVRSSKDDRNSMWSKPVIHNTNMGNKGNSFRNDTNRPADPRPSISLQLLPTRVPPVSTTPLTKFPSSGDSVQAPTTKTPPNTPERPRNPAGNFTTFSFCFCCCGVMGMFGDVGPEDRRDAAWQLLPETYGKCSIRSWKSHEVDIKKKKIGILGSDMIFSDQLFPFTAARQETWEDSDLFKSQPTSDIDAMGKKRYVAPHVVYQTGKKPDEPCSITSSLSYFPEDQPGEANVTAPPRNPPSNLTVVTVEGCPSFIILDWEKTDNDTTEYEVISTAKGPDGEQVSVLTTNQTHTAVENLRPESSYEFKVKPKNELGAGPPSEPVSFNTESADPRVSENVSGKDAIWTQFPFKTDSYSDCHGKQYVKRTWYRKFVGIQLCNSLRYKIYLSDSLNGKFYNIGDQTGFGEDHCQFVDSFLDGRTGRQLQADQLPSRPGFYRALRQEPVHFGQIGGHSHINYVSWYECGTPIPGKW